MKTVKFEIELQEGSFKTYTADEYAAIEKDAKGVFEDAAEYLGHVFMFKSALPDGTLVWVGVN